MGAHGVDSQVHPGVRGVLCGDVDSQARLHAHTQAPTRAVGTTFPRSTRSFAPGIPSCCTRTHTQMEEQSQGTSYNKKTATITAAHKEATHHAHSFQRDAESMVHLPKKKTKRNKTNTTRNTHHNNTHLHVVRAGFCTPTELARKDLPVIRIFSCIHRGPIFQQHTLFFPRSRLETNKQRKEINRGIMICCSQNFEPPSFCSANAPLAWICLAWPLLVQWPAEFPTGT